MTLHRELRGDHMIQNTRPVNSWSDIPIFLDQLFLSLLLKICMYSEKGGNVICIVTQVNYTFLSLCNGNFLKKNSTLLGEKRM